MMMKSRHLIFGAVVAIIAGGLCLLRKSDMAQPQHNKMAPSDFNRGMVPKLPDQRNAALESREAERRKPDQPQEGGVFQTVKGNIAECILLARKEYPEVFAECQKFVRSLREDIEPKSLSRDGYLQGSFRKFVRRGPEKRFVEKYMGQKQTSRGSEPRYERIEKYTDLQVRQGKARNAVARMAVLEHFLKFSHDATPYEQTELIGLLITWWFNGRYNELNNLDVLGILEAVAADESRHLVVRAHAAKQLPKGRQPDMNKLMLTILKSDTINDEHQHYRLVQRACNHLRQHGGNEVIKQKVIGTAKSFPYWKQVMIYKAAGLPPPKDNARVEDIKVDVH